MTETTKDAMLARIRKAIAHLPEPSPALYKYNFRTQDERDHAIILEEFIDRLIGYKALVTRTNEANLPQDLAHACQQHNLQRIVIPIDLPSDLVPTGVTALRDVPLLTPNDLDSCDGALTGCAMAIAQTGTIILAGGAMQGRRAISLLPDKHLCIVRSEQVLGLVPEAISRLREHNTYPITLISGPSATSDIELNRVEGVHGPRTLHVFVVG